MCEMHESLIFGGGKIFTSYFSCKSGIRAEIKYTFLKYQIMSNVNIVLT